MIALALLLAFVGYLLIWTAFRGADHDYNPFRVIGEAL